jgi:hypothetical protein
MTTTARRATRTAAAGSALVLAALIAPAGASAKHFSPWSPAVPEAGVNTAAAEGCPIESPDGLELYLASNRPGAVGGPGDPNDIWVATRPSTDAPWSTPTNLGAPVNSAAGDYCPTPLPGKRMLFVSAVATDAACGGGDLYLTRRNPALGWEPPQHLGCAADGTGPSFAGGEFGPSLVETDEGTFLYFSSTGPDPSGDQDIYVSRQHADGSFGPPSVVAELSDPVAQDLMPNVTQDGKEMVFNSNRPGGLGGQDIWSSTRASTSDPWSPPVNLGPAVNTAGNETRASLSRDRERLHLGRDGDIYVATRERTTGRP